MKHIALTLLSGLVLATSATAAEKEKPKPTEVIANDGIAFSRVEGEKDQKKVIAYDVMSAWKNREPRVADCDAYSSRLKSVIWCFASAANKTAFDKATDKEGDNKYLPFAGGRCALGTSWGYLNAKGDPRTARILQHDLGPILVLQSQQKWWPTFSDKNEASRLADAQIVYSIAKMTGHIVPNAQERSTAQN
jgi:hypothetical protein